MDAELQSLPEIADTQVRPAPARLFVAACLLTFLAMPLAQHVLPSGDEWGLRPGPFADFAAALADVDQGDPSFFAANRRLKAGMEDFERALEERSHLREQALPTLQWLLAAYGGAGNETVYLGRGGWLLLRPGFDSLTGKPFLDARLLERRRLAAPAWEPPPDVDPRPAILDFHRQLEARGIRLLVLPVPTKPAVHPEAAAPALAGYPQPLENPSFAPFRAGLERAGVELFDPAPAMVAERFAGREQYLRTDSHWSPAGVDAVARGLAERIRALDLPFAGATVSPRRRPQRLEGVGDLAKSLSLPPWQRLYPPEVVELRPVDPVRGRAEVLILGDSFANVYSRPELGWGRAAGLPEQLAYHLRRPVDRLAVNDGGAAGTRRRLAQEMASGRDRLAGVKLVIYQFATRDLAVGDWQPVALP